MPDYSEDDPVRSLWECYERYMPRTRTREDAKKFIDSLHLPPSLRKTFQPDEEGS